MTAGAAGSETAVTSKWVAALKAGGFLGDGNGVTILCPNLSYRLRPRHALGVGAAWEYWRHAPEEHLVIIKGEYRARPFDSDRDISLYLNAGSGIRLPPNGLFGAYTAAVGIGKEYRISGRIKFALDLGLRGIILGPGAGLAFEGAFGISN